MVKKRQTARTHNDFSDYYIKQAGSGVSNVYRGVSYQRGHGIGSFLAGIFRRALPFIKAGAKAVGKETAKAGLHVLGDVSSNIPVKEALQARFGEARDSLKKKAVEKIDSLMKGSGYKMGKRRRKTQSRTRGGRVRKRKISRSKRGVARSRKILKRKSKKRIVKFKKTSTRDIFS
jgi:hypothetical protein